MDWKNIRNKIDELLVKNNCEIEYINQLGITFEKIKRIVLKTEDMCYILKFGVAMIDLLENAEFNDSNKLLKIFILITR